VEEKVQLFLQFDEKEFPKKWAMLRTTFPSSTYISSQEFKKYIQHDGFVFSLVVFSLLLSSFSLLLSLLSNVQFYLILSLPLLFLCLVTNSKERATKCGTKPYEVFGW